MIGVPFVCLSENSAHIYAFFYPDFFCKLYTRHFKRLIYIGLEVYGWAAQPYTNHKNHTPTIHRGPNLILHHAGDTPHRCTLVFPAF